MGCDIVMTDLATTVRLVRAISDPSFLVRLRGTLMKGIDTVW